MIFLKKYLLIGTLILSASLVVGCGTKNQLVGEYDVLARHLTETGVKVYGATGCGACQMQKELFGDSWQYINYEDCHADGSRQQLQICAEHNIKAYPTWEFSDGEKRKGVIRPEELAEISNFS